MSCNPISQKHDDFLHNRLSSSASGLLRLLEWFVMLLVQIDPTLSRTVLVSTKLDTRIPQFSTPSDVDAFLKAPGESPFAFHYGHREYHVTCQQLLGLPVSACLVEPR
jgi:hypothetical protein